jgi:hypothetical protein
LLPLHIIPNQRARSESGTSADCRAHAGTVKCAADGGASRSSAESTDARAFFATCQGTAGAACGRRSDRYDQRPARKSAFYNFHFICLLVVIVFWSVGQRVEQRLCQGTVGRQLIEIA